MQEGRGYSAYEHSKLSNISTGTLNSQETVLDTISLPLDVSLETIVAAFLICLGFVTGAEALQPIRWRIWAEKVKKEGEREGGVGAIEGLEDRAGFVDIRVSSNSSIFHRTVYTLYSQGELHLRYPFSDFLWSLLD